MNKNKNEKAAPKAAKVAKVVKTANRGPGRPKYEIKWPKGEFTFTDLEVANGVDPENGKGDNCTTLTLRKGLKRELSRRAYSAVIIVKDKFAAPSGKSGLGRKQFVYKSRSVVSKSTKDSAPVSDTAPVAPVADTEAASVDVGTGVSKETEDYEAQKAALLGNEQQSSPAPVAEVAATEAVAS